MRCRALALLACACTEPAPPLEPPPAIWVYPPAPVALLAEPIARIGRSQAPQAIASMGIAGIVKVPLRLATPWAVPAGKEGRARAIIYGIEGSRSAIELVDIDDGRVQWRDTTACAAPVVGVTENAIVCVHVNEVRGVGVSDGKQTWKREGTYVAMTEDRVVMISADGVSVHDAESGDELTRVKLPKTVGADEVIASCGDAGRELFAVGRDGKLVRIAEVKGGPGVVWATPVGRIDEIEACDGPTVLVREAGVGGGTLVAIDRASGKVTGRATNVHGHWQARDGSGRLEIASDGGVATWPRDLVGPPTQTSTIAFGELLAERGEMRLVRGTEKTAVLLDREGVRAYVPFAAMGAVLGDSAFVSASWIVDHAVRRFAIPARYRKALRLSPRRAGVAPPAELRDLPVAEPIESVIEKADTAMQGVRDVVIDPRESHVLYAVVLEKPDEESGTPGIAAVDLAKRTWRWQRADGCGTGEAVGIAVARDVVVCASRTRTSPTAIVHATSREGTARWEWETDRLTRIDAAGDVVLAFDGDRMTVLDAGNGKPRWRITSDDGAVVVAAAVAIGEATYVVSAERNRVVARIAAGLPLWSIAVDGVVSTIVASDAGVLVTLEDGDAYRIDVAGTVHAMPGLNLDWLAGGNLVAGYTAGGPIPGTPVAPPTPLRVLRPILRRSPPPPEDPERPRMWTPIPPPPPLGDSWQLTLYELEGGLRARNDYGLFAPIVPGPRGPVGSPIVVASGPGFRDVLAIDPRNGDPLRRIQLDEDSGSSVVFGTIVDGTPVAGVVLKAPLRVVIF